VGFEFIGSVSCLVSYRLSALRGLRKAVELVFGYVKTGSYIIVAPQIVSDNLVYLIKVYPIFLAIKMKGIDNFLII